MLEVDFELVPFDLRHGPVAELGVEDPLAERDVGAAGVAEAYGGSLDLHHPRGSAFEAACHRPAPAGAAGGAAGDVGEGVGAFGPVGAPEGLAARHGLLAVDMGFGELGDEAAGDAA